MACTHDRAQEFTSFRSFDASVDHRDQMAIRPEFSQMVVSRVYARLGIGWAWTVCPTCVAPGTPELVAAPTP